MDPFSENTEPLRASHSSDEDKIRRFAKIAIIYHLALIPLLLFAGHWLLRMADFVGGWFEMATLVINKNDFWMAPIVGVLITLAVSAFRVYANPRRLEWLQPLLLIHGISALSFLAFYFLDVRSMSYLLATILEAGWFAVTLYVVVVFRKPQEPSPGSGM